MHVHVRDSMATAPHLMAADFTGSVKLEGGLSVGDQMNCCYCCVNLPWAQR